ncbi:hypothetical protein OEZ85_003013 [Tetradesmus obliquus]|uniref:Ion transport domain-containing protein n=1 Tax=Tetradesmus obliquus TaxID=3088 RepID=A0ABY8U3H2_TETOB|nr:hypothetical protein OEZ85_003013 [Tetradesmus obliquus]
MRAAYPLAAPCCSAQRCCLPHVLSRPGPGFSRVPKRPLLTTAALKRTNNDNEGSTADSWLQQRSRLAVQFLKEQQAQWLYRYFRDWRKDAFSDLQAILLLALAVNLVLAGGKVLLLGESSKGAWEDFYHNAVVAFGEAWPSDTAPVLEQVYSVGLYLAGLIGFAVLLALVEQSVLGVYEARVELGAPVLEAGHMLVLAWCRSQADVSKLEGVLRQLCAAYACSGGRTLVVLCQRKKTEMEDLFSAAIPQQQRGGSRFVFRQGSPLNAGDLKLVAADDASAVLVLADSAVSADASDSQVLRVLVLLDESEVAARQEGRPRPTPGHVVAEILSNDAMPLLKFVPSKPVLPLPSHRLNATRLAMLVTRPVVSHLTDTMWDFSNSSAVFMHHFSQLAGSTVADVALRFEDGILIGLLEASTGFVLINPPPGYTLSADEHLILLRPTAACEADVQPLPVPVSAPIGSYSAEAAAAAWRQSQQSLSMPMGVMDLLQGTRPGVASCRMFSLAEASMQLSRLAPLALLVLGWGEHDFMAQLLAALGTGSSALPAGSSVTFGNSHAPEASLHPAIAAAGGPQVLAGLTVQHVRLDPLSRGSWLGKLQLDGVNAAIVLCDAAWRHSLTPDPFAFSNAAAAAGNAAVYSSSLSPSVNGSLGGSNGSLDAAGGASSASSLSAAAGTYGAVGGAGSSSMYAFGAGGSSGFDCDVLQLDALLLRVQLNLRSALQGIDREQEVNIITEKVGTEQDTRFEDKARLPLGVPVNLSSYSACMLSQLAFCPLMVLPGRSTARPLGAQIDPLIVDADLYTDVGDKVSFWSLMRRAQLLGHVLLGYYLLPAAAADPIEAVLCPPGAMRGEARVWNRGDNRLKFIVLQDAEAANSQQQQQQQLRDEAVAASVAGSAAARAAAAAAKAAAEASARYYPVDGGWQWWMR